MPREARAKRNSVELEVPELDKDAPERKRVLNVLAQRRYRQRKKEQLKKLEERIQAASSQCEAQEKDAVPSEPSSSCGSPSDGPQTPVSPVPLLGGDAQMLSIAPKQVNSSKENPILQGSAASPWPFSFEAMEPSAFWDPSFMLPSLPSTPLSSTFKTPESNDGASSATSPLTVNSITPFQELVFGSEPPDQSIARLSFPDEANLKMLELDLLRASMAIAKRMHIDDIVFSLTAASPYADPTIANLTFEHLPVNLWPTKVQLNIPHHPFLDLLPWPTVRNKLILVFSQKPEMRPPQAASPLALLELVYDIEDSAEGVRIWGDDLYSDANWEVGEKVFSRWWWAFDGNIIKRSNDMRRERGAPTLGVGMVLGEV